MINFRIKMINSKINHFNSKINHFNYKSLIIFNFSKYIYNVK